MTSFADLLSETALDWSPHGSGFSSRLHSCAIVAELQGEHVVFCADLAHLRHPATESLAALDDFMGKLSSRLRHARGLRRDNKVVMEVVLPCAMVTTAAAAKAIEALGVGISLAAKECAALTDPVMARHYLDFHNKGERST